MSSGQGQLSITVGAAVAVGNRRGVVRTMFSNGAIVDFGGVRLTVCFCDMVRVLTDRDKFSSLDDLPGLKK